MAGTIETQVNSLPSHEYEATPELAHTSRGRRIAIWGIVAAAVAGVGALSVAVVRDADHASPSRPAPAVVEPEHTDIPDPLVTRFGRHSDTAPDKLYPAGNGVYVK